MCQASVSLKGEVVIASLFNLADLGLPNFVDQMKEEPAANKAINDLIAIAGGDEQMEGLILSAVMTICCEKLARAWGRQRCVEKLEALAHFAATATPSRAWPK